MTVHPKQRNTHHYIVIKIVILDKIRDMIVSFHSQHCGKDVYKQSARQEGHSSIWDGNLWRLLDFFFQYFLFIYKFHLVLDDINQKLKIFIAKKVTLNWQLATLLSHHKNTKYNHNTVQAPWTYRIEYVCDINGQPREGPVTYSTERVGMFCIGGENFFNATLLYSGI